MVTIHARHLTASCVAEVGGHVQQIYNYELHKRSSRDRFATTKSAPGQGNQNRVARDALR